MSDPNAAPDTRFRSPGSLSRRQSLRWAAAGIATPLLQACGGGSSSSAAPIIASALPESVAWCRNAILAKLAKSGTATSAVSVALMADDSVVWREAFGYSDREKGVLATPDVRFNIGSVAKVVTALAVMILRDRGQLTLDQPLVELLPGFSMLSPAFAQVTVRQMISHSSGFPGFNKRNNWSFVPYLDYAEDTMASLAKSHLKHEPGELAVYCNDGFTMVEPMVKALTGLSFAEFVKREIFDPLGMSLSAYPLTFAAEGTFVHPYYQGRSLPQEMATALATGGIISTPTDMLKFARLLMNEGVHEGRRIVSAASVQEMGLEQSGRTLINPCRPAWRWGLGWDTVRQKGLDAAGIRAWGKNGGTYFFLSEFIVLPEARLAMFISGCGYDYDSLNLAEGLLLRVAAERGLISALPTPIVSTTPSLASPVPDRTDLVGVYASELPPVQVLSMDDGSLALRHWSETARQWESTTRLRARSDGNWWADGQSTICYRFQTVGNHRYLIRRQLAPGLLYWSELPVGEWLPPLETPLPAAWQARLGMQWLYVSDSPDAVFSRLDPPRFARVDELAELPGYVFYNNAQLMSVVDDTTTGMIVKLPGNDGRDLLELRVVVVDGQEEIHIGTQVFKKSATS